MRTASMSMIVVVVAIGSSGLQIPGVRVLLAKGAMARAGGSGYGGGEVAARVWGERRGRWCRDREEKEALEREERGTGVGKPLGYFFLDLNDYIASLFIVLSRLIS